MIISDEQVRCVLECLRDHDMLEDATVATDSSCTPELLARVNELLADLPDTRSERVRQAQSDMANGGYSSEDVADKIVARIISDSLR